MQTFLPYESFVKTFWCLDTKRHGKQRVEARQIYWILTGKQKTSGWQNHPAVLMWKGHESILALYYNICVDIWIEKGYRNTMEKIPMSPYGIHWPRWYGDKRFHNSHKSNLLRKAPEHYGIYQWEVPDNLPYFWPTKEGY